METAIKNTSTFFADSLEQNLGVWEYTAGWFQEETGLDNSTVLVPKKMSNKVIIIGADTTNPLTARTPGYGTMRLTGKDIWGELRDRDGAIALLRRAVELGVNFFDTADFYGPGSDQ